MQETMGTLEAFGHEPTEARLRIIPRPASWRVPRALLSAVAGLGAAPVVFFVPPHVPWALGSVGLGLFFARRFALETTTLLEMHGTCPKCGAAVTVERPVALRSPHALSCPACLQGLMLTADG